MSCGSDSVLPIFDKKTKQKRTGKKLLFESTSDDQGSSSESLTDPSRRSAASLVWKRPLTSSDDEDENPHSDS